MTLRELGWTEADAAAFAAQHSGRGLSPARVVRTSKHAYHVAGDDGIRVARVGGGYRHQASCPSEFPAVGDWAAVRPKADTEEMVIASLLPRRSAICRQAIGGSGRGRKIVPQVLAANVDFAFVVAALDGGRGFNLRRLERYLTLVREGGVEPVVLLNKADLCDDTASPSAKAQTVSGGAPVHVVSADSGTGIASLEEAYLSRGRTLVLLGPSGVGKSSIINCLLGHEAQQVGAVRDSDARGTHTTTWSEIRALPGGAVLIDTPGMREVIPWADPVAVADTFPEIREIAAGCRFADCAHQAEPGCAVRAAVDSGQLAAERFESFLKLRDEAENAGRQLARERSKREGTRAVRVRREKRRRWEKR